MMRSFVLGAVGCLAVAGALGAQTDKFTTATSYSLSIPTGDTRHFVTTPSWVGLNWEGAWALARHTSAGVAFSFHDFNDLSSGTTNFPSGSATGRQMRDLLVTTLMATGRWYPIPDRSHRPYLALQTGFVYSDETYQLGLTQNSRSAFHLAIAPEAGWEFPLMEGIGAFVSARYTRPTSTGHYIGGGPRAFPFATLSFGVVER